MIKLYNTKNKTIQYTYINEPVQKTKSGYVYINYFTTKKYGHKTSLKYNK